MYSSERCRREKRRKHPIQTYCDNSQAMNNVRGDHRRLLVFLANWSRKRKPTAADRRDQVNYCRLIFQVLCNSTTKNTIQGNKKFDFLSHYTIYQTVTHFLASFLPSNVTVVKIK